VVKERSTMKKNILFLMIAALLCACTSSSEKDEQLIKHEEILNEEVEVENFEVLEEQVEELSFYQTAVQQHEKSSIFPHEVVLQANNELYNKEGLNFHSIVKTMKNYFVVEYITYATEVENTYYFIFDYNGNQLDVALVNTVAIDLDGEIVFITDSTFQINRIIKEIEWDEADAIEVGESKRDTIYYTLTNKGKIIKK
jgi:hypothetical protein